MADIAAGDIGGLNIGHRIGDGRRIFGHDIGAEAIRLRRIRFSVGGEIDLDHAAPLSLVQPAEMQSGRASDRRRVTVRYISSSRIPAAKRRRFRRYRDALAYQSPAAMLRR